VTHTQNAVSNVTPVISKEVAEAELERFLEAMDLKERTEQSRLDAEDKRQLVEVKENVISAIMSGRLVISEDGTPVYTPKAGDMKPIKFNEPDGACLMAMDKLKHGHNMAKQNAVLGAMTGEGPQRFANMKQRDLRVCGDLLTLFLA
jgi:hypothetical protein